MTPASLQRWQVAATIGIAILSAVSSLLGLFRPGHYPSALLPAFYVQDLLLLVLAVPVLTVALRYAMAGSLRARIVWLGALAYMTYMWASIALQVPFNRFFLGYVALFSLSMFTFVGGAVTVDAEAVRRSLAGRVSERVYGAVLVVIALGLATLWLAELVPATLTGTPPLLVDEIGSQALVSHFVDLAVVVPALLIAGGWLWRGRSWGYAFAGVGLVFGALLAPTIAGMTVVLVLEDDVTVPLVAVVFTTIPILLAAVLAGRYVSLLSGAERVASSDEGSQPSTADG
ncbi:hypothetical protein SAMN05444422_104203 [Halobiforma haloterrestris]|uniref:Uncharacterized protein n=1 Tax=Natronobacterium haloterrestre TaxID=148448 RepID=A0A1I1GBV5_NATHA|nr:hypothetical protein [Halobiforma haloterrestris]SFC08896.1 hypothetical protein SAMN05444422_104203 [Halobiforma haloterrestris]